MGERCSQNLALVPDLNPAWAASDSPGLFDFPRSSIGTAVAHHRVRKSDFKNIEIILFHNVPPEPIVGAVHHQRMTVFHPNLGQTFYPQNRLVLMDCLPHQERPTGGSPTCQI